MSHILRMYTQQGFLVFLGFAFNLISINGKVERERERLKFNFSYFIPSKKDFFLNIKNCKCSGQRL